MLCMPGCLHQLFTLTDVHAAAELPRVERHYLPVFLLVPCRYTSERPWAGMHPVQVMMKKAQGGASLPWPAAAPEPYARLAQVRMFSVY